jgi:hypothetical protein
MFFAVSESETLLLNDVRTPVNKNRPVNRESLVVMLGIFLTNEATRRLFYQPCNFIPLF